MIEMIQRTMHRNRTQCASADAQNHEIIRF